MANFKFDEQGMADLQKQLGQQLKKAEAEANAAAAKETTPDGKARAFAKVLRKHGVKDVDEAKIRRTFAK